MERRRVVYEGEVQGVGFRARARQIARSHGVSGYIRNLGDGTVELVVEADPRDVDAFLATVAAEMGDAIASAREERGPASGAGFSGFSIAP